MREFRVPNLATLLSGCKESEFYSLLFGQAVATIGDKIVETLYSNRVPLEKKELAPLSCPLHSKLGCLLFSLGSSNIGTTLHGGDGGGKGMFPAFEVSET